MHHITLLGTVHEAAGECNFQSLYRILEAINPQVIFEELFPSDFDAYYKDKTKTRLEPDVINLYSENHKIIHIPVDYDYMPPKTFWDRYHRMHVTIEAHSPEYRNTVDTLSFYKRQYGFRFLNSPEHERLNREWYDAISNTLLRLNNEEFSETHEEWLQIIRRREDTMVGRIYEYSKGHEYTTGLFYTGASHRESIMQIIQEHETQEKMKLNWKFRDYEGIL